MSAGQVRVAVIGAGNVGCGWAALCVAKGWPVSIFDTDANVLVEAQVEVATRARSLVAMERAEHEEAEAGIASFVRARSLLECCREAQWVIEAGPEDLKAKQRIFEAVESVAGKARAVTSSASALKPADIAARCLRQDRCFIAHPQDPPELIPLVELVPTPSTDAALVELVKGWLHALGRIPIVVKKPVPGNIGSRIAAAVWREAIELVLDGVVDVDDLDRAVSVGPALAWAAGGPHLSYRLAAGERGVAGFFQYLLQSYQPIWEDLAGWSQLDPDRQRKLIHLIERAYDQQVETIRPARDRRLVAMLRGLEQARGK